MLAFRLTDLLSAEYISPKAQLDRRATKLLDTNVRDEALDYLRFWLQSISTHAVATSEQLTEAQLADDDEARLAPMLLIGTRLDEVAGESREEKLANLRSIQSLLEENFADIAAFARLEKGSLLRNTDDLCFFPVDNSDPKDSSVNKLRGLIVECARQDKLDYGALKVPGEHN